MPQLKLFLIGAAGQIGSYFLLKLYGEDRQLGIMDLSPPLKALVKQEVVMSRDLYYPQDHTRIPLGSIQEDPDELRPGQLAAFSPEAAERVELAEEAIIFVAVKAYDYPVVQDTIKKILRPDTIITYLVNGLAPEEKALAGHKERSIDNPLVRAVIMGGTDFEIEEQGGRQRRLVRSGISDIVIGNWLEEGSEDFAQLLERVRDVFAPEKLLVRPALGNDFRRASFDKTLANLINPLSALIGCTCGEVIDNQSLRTLISQMIGQGIAVGKELGLELGNTRQLIDSRLKMYQDAGHQHLSSMGRDALLSALRGTRFRHENENIGVALAEKASSTDISILREVNRLLDEETLVYNQLQQADPELARHFLLHYWLMNRAVCGLSPSLDYIVNQYPDLPRYLAEIKPLEAGRPPVDRPEDLIQAMKDNLTKVKTSLKVELKN